MTQRAVIENMLERYGEDVSLDGIALRAVIQPLQHRTGAAAGLPDEYYDSLHYLYTGPAGQKLSPGGTVGTARRNYSVLRADSFLFGGEALYEWAILKALAPGADETVTVETQGTVVATAERYEEKVLRESHAVTGWGESCPAAMTAGAARYEIKLENVQPEHNTDLFALGDFSVAVKSPGKRTVYSGCRWSMLSAAGGRGEQAVRSMRLLAAERKEEKDGEGNG